MNQEEFNILASTGWSNLINLIAKEGENANLNTKITDEKSEAYTLAYMTIRGENVKLPFRKFSKQTWGVTNSIPQAISLSFLEASNWLKKMDGENGAKYAITNITIASGMLQQDTLFSPLAINLHSDMREIYCIGTLAGIAIYINPLMSGDDNRVVIGTDREFSKDTPNKPCLTFCLTGDF